MKRRGFATKLLTILGAAGVASKASSGASLSQQKIVRAGCNASQFCRKSKGRAV
jgi:hypothetical protein